MNMASRFIRFKVPNREFSSVKFRKDVWTSDRVVKSPCKDIIIPKITLDEYIWKNLDKWPNKTAAVNAFQVPPAELEYVLKEHPDVFDAAVIGIPDPASGERPKALVILKEGATTTDKQIMEFVNERVAKFKRIREISFVDSIPKNPSGKILRKVLKEQYC